MASISRRTFIKIASAGAGVAVAKSPDVAAAESAAQRAQGEARRQSQGSAGRAPYGFFNAEEAAFIEAAVARLIPTDETGPGAKEADVAGYIDKQLAGAWGAGERLYRSGPWRDGTPQQGYQLPFTPAQLFRVALRGLSERAQKSNGKPFAQLAPAEQDAFLKNLETSAEEVGGVPGNVFFASLLEMTIEGFFADPVYGGNRGMVGWKLIGFPGAYANYYQYVDQHGMKFDREPTSLAESGSGEVHVHPQIPAYIQGSKWPGAK